MTLSLAEHWPASKVERCLARKGKKDQLVCFLRDRYRERFFDPINSLLQAPCSEQGYGFSIMALCSLPIETMQCYLPSTHGRELEKLGKKPDVPSEYKVPNKYKNGREVFKAFFSEQSRLFPGVDGSQFYDCIRNGLLHQAQTKSGWKIRVKQARLCDPEKKVIDRDRFVRSLGAYFKRFLGELNMKKWDEDLWKNTRRKIWWLIQLSRSK